MERAEPSQEKTELVKEKKLEDLPVEVLVKIFNYLRNNDIHSVDYILVSQPLFSWFLIFDTQTFW